MERLDETQVVLSKPMKILGQCSGVFRPVLLSLGAIDEKGRRLGGEAKQVGCVAVVDEGEASDA